MLVIMIWVFAISCAIMVPFGIVVMHLRKKYPFLRKRVRVDVKTAYKIPDKTDVDGNPLYKINGEIQGTTPKARRQAYEQGKRLSEIPFLYIHLDGIVDAKRRCYEVLINDTIVLIKSDYLITNEKELKVYIQYKHSIWLIVLTLMVSIILWAIISVTVLSPIIKQYSAFICLLLTLVSITCFVIGIKQSK